MKHICTAESVVNCILDKPIKWIDFRKMPKEERISWGASAKQVLENRAFQSIVGTDKVAGEYVKNCIESIARHSKTQEETEKIRHLIIGMERLREMLEEMIVDPEKLPTKNDIHAAI